MPENSPRPEPQEKNRKRSPALEAGAVAVALLAMQCDEAKSLEMDPYTPWVIGVQDTIRNAVEHDTVEHATTYVQFTDGSSVWTKAVRGDIKSVTTDLGYENTSISNEGRQREIAKMCRIHLHEAAIFKKFASLSIQPANPPSHIDIASTRGARNYYQEAGLHPEQVVHAVADAHGIWYYRPLSSSELQKYPTAFVQTVAAGPSRTPQPDWYGEFSTYVRDSISPDFNSKKDFPKLRHAYQAYLGGDVRFVPYEQVAHEPACAGVDYDPKKGFVGGNQTAHN